MQNRMKEKKKRLRLRHTNNVWMFCVCRLYRDEMKFMRKPMSHNHKTCVVLIFILCIGIDIWNVSAGFYQHRTARERERPNVRQRNDGITVSWNLGKPSYAFRTVNLFTCLFQYFLYFLYFYMRYILCDLCCGFSRSYFILAFTFI